MDAYHKLSELLFHIFRQVGDHSYGAENMKKKSKRFMIGCTKSEKVYLSIGMYQETPFLDYHLKQ